MEKSICNWKYDDSQGSWETDCGKSYCIDEGAPSENEMKFCTFCGKNLSSMKELSKESQEFITNLVHELKTQSNRGTSLPILYMIQEKYKKYHDDGSKIEWCKDGDVFGFEDVRYTALEYIAENPKEYNLDSEIDDDVIEEIAEDKLEYSKLYYDVEKRFAEHNPNVFLTEKAAKMHIKANHYHYWDGRDYVIHAWRNPEMEMLQKILFELVGEKWVNK